ncbi:MAG TPA: hypothetical protein VGN72_09055 [Tepidisphaeraceae bacterium]|jgi:hypothetical protein|nr:hypothetical protein [Tepidisphaeraceae bacterium]
MAGFEEEVNLVGFLAVNVIVLLGAWRLARRTASGDDSMRWLDTLTLWFLVQYATIGVAGLLHGLNVPVVYTLAIGCGGAMAWAGGRGAFTPNAPLSDTPPKPLWHSLITAALLALPIGFIAAYIYEQRFVPVLANDTLAYHLPAAVQWLQEGRLSLYDVWHWNPANTYSPLAGSTFIAWLVLPFGHDVLARFVQIPAVALIGVATVALCTAMSVPRMLAIAIAATVVLSRPTISEATLAKDDLFVVALFIAIIATCGIDRLRASAGPVRVGVLIGLLLAMKYTVLLIVPVLLLLIDAPLRAGWRPRHWLTAIGVATLLAGPWYLRNWLLTGNPLFPIDVRPLGIPIFEGMFASRRDDALVSPALVWRVLTGTYFSLPAILLVPAALLALSMIAFRARQLLANPMERTLLIGPFIGIALFVAAAPFAESRFLFPLFAMLLIAAGVTIARLLPSVAFSLPAALFLLVLAIATAFEQSHVGSIVLFATAGLLVAVAAMAIVVARRFLPRVQWYPSSPIVGAVVGSLAIYVCWHAYVADYLTDRPNAWRNIFGTPADAWAFVNMEIPPEATVAIGNTVNVYPLFGDDNARRLTYAPLRPNVSHVHDLPPLYGQSLNGADIIRLIPPYTVAGAERHVWLENLRGAGAQYLYIAKREAIAEPVELQFANGLGDVFVPIFENADAVVYRIAFPTQDD